MGKGQRRNTRGTISAAFARWLLAVGGLLVAGALWAQGGPVGALDHVVGSVFVQTTGSELKRAEKGTPVANGDTVTTDAGAYANIRFVDGAEVFLRPNGRVLIEAYVFEKDRAERDSFVYRLLKGSLRAITGQIGKRGNTGAYRLNTAISTIGIRGSEFDARLCEGDCPGRADGQYTDAKKDTHTVSNEGGDATVSAPDGSYTKDAKTPPQGVKDGSGLDKDDPPRPPGMSQEEFDKALRKPFEDASSKSGYDNREKHAAENAAYKQKVKTYLDNKPHEGTKAHYAEPLFIYSDDGKIIGAVQWFELKGKLETYYLLTHFIRFDANGNTQGYMLTPAGRSMLWIDEQEKKYGIDRDDTNKRYQEGLDANGLPVILTYTAAGGGVRRSYAQFNTQGNAYFWQFQDEDGNTLVKREDISRYPPLQKAPMKRFVTGICENIECRRREDTHNAIALRMNALAVQLDTIDTNLKTTAGDKQAAERARHAELFKEWQEMTGPLSAWEAAVRECQELCSKNKGLFAVWNPIDITACNVTARSLQDLAAANEAAGGTLRNATRVPEGAGGGAEGESAQSGNACMAPGAGNKTDEEKDCSKMAPEAPGRKPTGSAVRSVGRNPVETQVAQGKSFAQPVVIDRAANADGNVINFLDGTGRPWQPQDARGPSVQTPTGGRFQIPASACPAGGGTLPLSQRIALGSFKTVDSDRVQEGVEYGQNAFNLLTRLEYLNYKHENGLPVEESDVKGLISEINGLRGGKFEKLGGVLDGIEKGFKQKEKIEGLISKAGEIIEFLDTAQRGREDPVQAAQALSMYLNLVGGIAGKVPGIGEFVSMYAKGVENMVQDLKTIQTRQNLTGQTIRDINDFTVDLTGERVPAETAASGPQPSASPSKLDADAVNRYNGTRAENDRLKQTTDDLKSTEKCIDRCRARIEALHRAIDEMRVSRAHLGTEKDLATNLDEMARDREYFLQYRAKHGENASPPNNADNARFYNGREATGPRMVDARARLAKLRAIEPRIQKALDEIAQLQKRLEDCNKRLAGEQRAYLQSLRAFVEKDEYLRLIGAERMDPGPALQQAKAIAEQIPLEPTPPGTVVNSGGSCGTVSVIQVCEETRFSIPRHPGPPVAASGPKSDTAAKQPPPLDFGKPNNVTVNRAQQQRETGQGSR